MEGELPQFAGTDRGFHVSIFYSRPSNPGLSAEGSKPYSFDSDHFFGLLGLATWYISAAIWSKRA
jgi:hypothetical protein